jgi:hypothetical protein
MQMGTFMRESGMKTRLMDMENTFMRMERYMRGNGNTINSRGREWNTGLMEHITRDSSLTEIRRDKETYFSLMVRFMRENLARMK